MTAIEAKSVELPSGLINEDGMYFRVGYHHTTTQDGKLVDLGEVTRVVVEDDLPGLHCNLLQVKVYIGETLIAAAPMTSAICVCYV